jgi:acyl-CoA dehydrogenase
METQEISRILLDQADRLFAQHLSREARAAAETGAWPENLWQAVAAAGLPLAMVPEAAGGAGLAPGDALRLVRRSGFHALPLPLAETMLGNALWAATGEKPLAQPVSFSATPPISLRGAGDNVLLDGDAGAVPWGDVAWLLVIAEDAAGGRHLALVAPPEAALPQRRNLAFEPRPKRHLAGVRPVALRPAPRLATPGLRALGAVLRAQQMVGAMERALDYALLYANERQQFGRPIGKFQAVQHMLASAAGQFAAATAAADQALEAWGGADVEFAAALAKARVGEAAGKIAEIVHQVHGAMGFTQEHSLHFLTRRLWSWRDECGNEAEWQRVIGARVMQAGGEALWPMLAGA